MRGFLILTGVVLFAIGTGVGITAATTSTYPLAPCDSVQQCVQAAHAFGFHEPLLVPRDRELRFVRGSFSRSTALGSVRPRWFLRLQFGDATLETTLVWTASEWSAANVPTCLLSSQEKPLTTTTGVTVCAYIGDAAVGFWAQHTQYVAFVPPGSLIPPSPLAWLVREVGDSAAG